MSPMIKPGVVQPSHHPEALKPIVLLLQLVRLLALNVQFLI